MTGQTADGRQLQSNMIELCANIRQIVVKIMWAFWYHLQMLEHELTEGIVQKLFSSVNEMGGSMTLNYVRINCK